MGHCVSTEMRRAALSDMGLATYYVHVLHQLDALIPVQIVLRLF